MWHKAILFNVTLILGQLAHAAPCTDPLYCPDFSKITTNEALLADLRTRMPKIRYEIETLPDATLYASFEQWVQKKMMEQKYLPGKSPAETPKTAQEYIRAAAHTRRDIWANTHNPVILYEEMIEDYCAHSSQEISVLDNKIIETYKRLLESAHPAYVIDQIEKRIQAGVKFKPTNQSFSEKCKTRTLQFLLRLLSR